MFNNLDKRDSPFIKKKKQLIKQIKRGGEVQWKKRKKKM